MRIEEAELLAVCPIQSHHETTAASAARRRDVLCKDIERSAHPAPSPVQARRARGNAVQVDEYDVRVRGRACALRPRGRGDAVESEHILPNRMGGVARHNHVDVRRAGEIEGIEHAVHHLRRGYGCRPARGSNSGGLRGVREVMARLGDGVSGRLVVDNICAIVEPRRRIEHLVHEHERAGGQRLSEARVTLPLGRAAGDDH
eukprot:CAMPEP_0185175694 /NCGR_PEP_ID=MMETSP1139-20130426/27194_1 /TAXON_ID=298111 /ORGANISM="Pavlova sp., Strain CCMP459" /LENGTH=201 /DNA_ID=CAMNT_0027741433 /DNA_START=200 /DNA_END=802 /DNA_ORIENTATION=+